MRDSAAKFFAALHETYLKPRGYKKVRHTFSRELKGYTERVQFQGSSWNDSERPWRFYINFGVEFRGLTPRAPNRGFPNTHCWTRLEKIVGEAPSQFDLAEGGSEELARKVADYLESASQQIGGRIDQMRREYVKNKSPWFTIV